jgi:hypothetical protein
MNRFAQTSRRVELAARARKPCDAKLRRALLCAMSAALQRSVVLLPANEAEERARREANLGF